MLNKKVIDENIEVLNLDFKLLKVLKNNDINIVSNLWEMSREDLKTINLSQEDIREIRVKLQLHGLDINRKIY